MSGICGLVDFAGERVSREVLRAMTESSAWRGGDGIHYRLAGAVGLAHLALHTTPESPAERQPLASRDGDLLLVADARLDNRGDLLRLLGGQESASDAELLLAAYRRWGTRCPEHLLGDFAFAVWDAPRRELFCACDHLGVKPLHYARTGSLFCFASDVHQILHHPAVPRGLDELSVGVYLCGDLLPEAGRTMFDSVRRLPPAHYLVAGQRRLTVARYWEIDPEKRTVHPRTADYAAHLLSLLRRAVADRLRVRGDVVGVSLSGGLDSTSVAALAQEAYVRGGSPRPVAASYVFDRLTRCDERTYIRAMAEELGLEVEHVEAEKYWALKDWPSTKGGLEAPPAGWEASFQELCRRFRERGGRVFLTGVGGDEVLGGLLVSGRAWRRWWLREAGTILRRARRQGVSVPRTIYRYWASRLLGARLDRALRRLAGRPVAASVPPWLGRDFVRRTRLEQWHRRSARRWRETAEQTNPWGLECMGRSRAVSWLDANAARQGLEPRHPFLDRRLVELVLSIPLEQVVRIGCSKPLLRHAMKGLLPEAIRTRRDRTSLSGFIDFSLREKEAPGIARLLPDSRAAELGFLDRERLQTAFQKYRSGVPDPDVERIWYTLAFEVWLRHYHGFLAEGLGPDHADVGRLVA